MTKQYELIVSITPASDEILAEREKALCTALVERGRNMVEWARRSLYEEGGLQRASVTPIVRPFDIDSEIGELMKEIASHGIPEDCFDEAVHDVASEAASTVNNQGMEAQLRYLLEELGREETRKIVYDFLVTESAEWFVIQIDRNRTCTIGKANTQDRSYIAKGIDCVPGYVFHDRFETQEAAVAFARGRELTIIDEGG